MGTGAMLQWEHPLGHLDTHSASSIMSLIYFPPFALMGRVLDNGVHLSYYMYVPW